MDRFRAIRTFVAVAERGSLSAAARKLNQPLTTISRQLASLEDHLGFSLLVRTTRRLALTEAGRDYLETCRRVLDDLDEAESRLQGAGEGLAGEIAITAPIVFGRVHILPLIGRFMSQHPHVTCRLMLSDKVVNLVEEGADVAVRIGPLPNSALVAMRVGAVRLVTCASPDYLRARGAPETPDDLAQHDCISFAHFTAGDRWTFRSRAYGHHGVRPDARLSVNTAEAAIDAAVAGIGVTRLLSYQVAAGIKAKRLRAVLEDYDDTELPVHLVHARQRLPKPLIAPFVAFAAPALRDVLSGIGCDATF